MIRSSIDRMVDVALQDLTSEQIILFIQSFGTPINSMSKLLALLDNDIVNNTESVNAAIINRAYLSQFIDIQQLRGAKNGHIAMKYLKSMDEKPQTSENKATTEVVDMLERFDALKIKVKSSSSLSRGKFSQGASSFNVSSLLGEIVNEDVKPKIEPFIDTKSSKILKLSDSGRNIHHTLSELINSTHPFEIEIFAHRHLNFKNLKQSKLAHLINSMCVMLKEENDNLSINKKGIILDWLVEFDSELIRTNQDVQISLLFGKTIQIYRPYLLSLLIHQANWSTIHLAIEKLFNPINSGIYDPTSVLDFTDAIIRNPKMWQGRDKAVPKHEQIEYVLNLDEHNTKAFIDYILQEEENMTAANSESKMNERVILLLSCIRPNELSLQNVLENLETSLLGQNVKNKFLRRLYLSIPNLFIDSDMNDIINESNELIIKESNSSISDKWIHTVITTLASLSNQKDFQAIGLDMELPLRKFAATYPVLLLRHLPLIASLLAGRGHMDLHILRQEHHIAFFNQILGTLELLQPMIFEDVYMAGLHKALQSFFILLQNHGKDLFGLIVRVMEFVKNYAAANPTSAYILINNHHELLSELFVRNRNIIPLQQIMTSSQFLAKGIAISALSSKPDGNQMNLSSKLGNITRISHEELLSTLQEIEYQTNKKPAQLVDIFGKLTELIGNDSSDVRNLAHSMLLKMLKHNPGNSVTLSTCFNAYLQCLHSDDVNIATSVLDNLTEITLSLQEYALDILKCVFNLGITSKINTLVPLKKCINAIKLQNSC